MSPLSWCLASSHLPVIVVSNGTGVVFPLSAAAVLSSNKMLKQAVCSSTLQQACHLYHLRWPFTFINKWKGYPPPNYILLHGGDTWQLSVIHVTPLLTCRKQAWIPTDKLLMIFSIEVCICFQAQPSATSECMHWQSVHSTSSFTGLVTYS